MKFGLALASYVYNEQRIDIASRSLISLAKTNVDGLEKPILNISHRPSSNFCYDYYSELLHSRFDVLVRTDPPEMTQAWIIHQDLGIKLLDAYPDITHVVFLCDDLIYNPEWLRELSKLVERHPDCRAWFVYRSAFTAYHRIVGGDGMDVLMTMHDGIGCVTRQEWRDFCGSHGYVGAPDINHAALRPGNRWATGRDYIQQIGDNYNAIDFVGE